MQQSVTAVITSFNQRDTLGDAVRSALQQSRPFTRIVVVDDGSTEAGALDSARNNPRVTVLEQANQGVSAARNTGIRATDTEFVAVLDGDDGWEENWAELVQAQFDDQAVIAASSHVQTFGAAEWLVKPAGGDVVAFLARNNCPSSLMFRRTSWQEVQGYDESLLHGFEDWDFALRLLKKGGRVGIVPQPLIRYRTVASSSNVVSMDRRLELYAGIIDRHADVFRDNFRAALLNLEAISKSRLDLLQELLVRHVSEDIDPLVTFGDGGVAAAVRAASARTRSRGLWPNTVATEGGPLAHR